MSEHTIESPKEIRAIAETALRLQGYLLRRAWGVFYVALAVSMLLSIFVTPTAAALFPSELTIVPHIMVNMIASLTAVIAILWGFKRHVTRWRLEVS